jgi:hypothetical protein
MCLTKHHAIRTFLTSMEVSGQLHAPAALPQGKIPPVPIGYEAGWTPDPIWTRLRREKFPALAGNRTAIVQPVA